MTTPPVTCLEADSIETAAALMWDRDCGALPVVDHEFCVVGMITDRDICMAACNFGRALNAIRVSGVISGDVFSVDPGASLQQAEEIMRVNQVRRLPVVDQDKRVLGMLSLNDIIREEAREKQLRLDKELSSREIVQTLAAICEPAEGGEALY